MSIGRLRISTVFLRLASQRAESTARLSFTFSTRSRNKPKGALTDRTGAEPRAALRLNEMVGDFSLNAFATLDADVLNALVTAVQSGEPSPNLHMLALLAGERDLLVARSLARLEQAGFVQQFERGCYLPTRPGEMRAAEMSPPV